MRLSARFAYIGAILPFGLLWLMSHGHIGAVWLLLPVVLCAIQAARPTRALWALIFIFFLIMGGIYGFLIVLDLLTIASGQGTPSALLDLDDSLILLAVESLILSMAFWLWKVRPPSPDSTNPFSEPGPL